MAILLLQLLSMLGFQVCATVLTKLLQQYTFGKVILFTQYIYSNEGENGAP